MQVKLVVVGGKANKREVELSMPATIGRSRDADLTVGHRMISRNHCEAYEVDGLVMIRDVGSLNGTFVRGQQVRRAPLPPGAKFSIGPITFRVEYDYSGDLSDLPPVVPAEESTEQAVSGAESKDPKTEPVQDKPATEAKPETEDIDEEVPDLQVVEEDDDDFELAIQESLAGDSDIASGKKKKSGGDDDEIDPEDQLMDDFLNDLQ